MKTKGNNELPKGIDKNFNEIADMINNLIGLVKEEPGNEKTVELLTKDLSSLEYVYNKLNNICAWLVANKGYKFE